jgi:hypothetical protein
MRPRVAGLTSWAGDDYECRFRNYQLIKDAYTYSRHF